MRIVRMFILRLLLDPAEPHALRGSLQAVSDSESLSFADEQGLLNLLHQLICETREHRARSVTKKHDMKSE